MHPSSDTSPTTASVAAAPPPPPSPSFVLPRQLKILLIITHYNSGPIRDSVPHTLRHTNLFPPNPCAYFRQTDTTDAHGQTDSLPISYQSLESGIYTGTQTHTQRIHSTQSDKGIQLGKIVKFILCASIQIHNERKIANKSINLIKIMLHSIHMGLPVFDSCVHGKRFPLFFTEDPCS